MPTVERWAPGKQKAPILVVRASETFGKSSGAGDWFLPEPSEGFQIPGKATQGLPNEPFLFHLKFPPQTSCIVTA